MIKNIFKLKNLSILIALAGLAVLAMPAAEASRARMSALGQGSDFSFYIKDQKLFLEKL